jgi:hypothetical protein
MMLLRPQVMIIGKMHSLNDDSCCVAVVVVAAAAVAISCPYCAEALPTATLFRAVLLRVYVWNEMAAIRCCCAFLTSSGSR